MQVIDVVVRWAGTVVAVERLALGEAFTLGAAAARPRHFVWDHDALAEGAHPVVAHRGDGVHLSAPPGASLVVDGARVAARALVVSEAQRASVVLGAIEISARPAARTRAAPAAREVDARFLRISGSALMVHAGLVCALLIARGGASLDDELPQATRMVADAWAARAPAPVAVRRAPQELERATVEDPARPSVRSPAVAMRRAPRDAATTDARTLARAALAALGLEGQGVSSVFGAGGPAIGASLRGQPGGAGADGLAGRRGGGGVAGATIGVGSLGPLGDGDGEDPSTIGLPAKERVPVRIVVDHFDHADGLTRDEIARVMDRARSQVKACYERELGGAPDLEGKVVLAFTVAATGHVAVARAAHNTLAGALAGGPGARVGACVERVVSRLKFPQPRGGGVVQVTYPFVLATSGG